MKIIATIARTVIILFLTKQMQAQQPAFYHLSTAEGLSDNNIHAVARDRNGILWVGTSEGLNSFDGNRITTYYKHKYPEIPDNTIERIVIDDDNNIWIRTNSSFVTMLDKKRKFHKCLVGDTLDGFNVSALFKTSKGIFAVKNRKYYLLGKNDSLLFKKISTPFDSLPGGTGFTYYPDNDKVIYYRQGKLMVADFGKMNITLTMAIPGLNGAFNIDDDKLIAFDREKNIFYRISISDKNILSQYSDLRDQYGSPITGILRNMTRIDETRFAFTTYFSGLYIINFSEQKAYHYTHDPIDPRSIGGNNTFNVAYDTSGYLFISTQTSGVHFLNLNHKNAFSKTYFIDQDKQIFDGYIHSITTDAEGNIWMGAQDRLMMWNRNIDKTMYVPIRLPHNNSNILGDETIREVHVDESGKFWVGTGRFGVLILNSALQVIKQITDSSGGIKTNLPSNWINAICMDKKGNTWVGTLLGTCIVNKDNYVVTSLNDHPVLGEMSRIPCSSIWTDEEGKIWIGTTRGVWCYDETNNSLKSYSTKQGLVHNTVYAVNKDLHGNTYFATLGGLSILSKEGKIINYDRSNGLRNDRCENILRDEKGFMWIGNLNCIIRYDPVNKKFAVYEEGYGFSHGGFRMRCAHLSSKGEMFWGTDKGLIYFLPEQMSNSDLPLHPFINTLQSSNDLFHFTSKDEVKFPYNASSFVFSFSSGELSGDKKIQLLYRLSGYDEEWRSPVSTGQVAFSKLQAGNYTFEIKASRDGSNWYEGAYPVLITVKKPWWQTWWFRSLMIVLAAGVIYFAYQYRLKRRKTREIQKTIDYFANSGYEYSTVNDILWDICRNCVSRLQFEDCVIYLLDQEGKMLQQKAAHGPKNPKEFEILNPIEIPVGKGIVGDVAATGKASLINDTSKDKRYIVDDVRRYSEITVPLVHEGKVIGVIDSEHPNRNFFTPQHLNALQSIAAICSTKISRAMAIDAMKRNEKELMELNVKMAESKFTNLRLQMNPHFLFNSLSSIQHLIVSKQTTKAYKYLTIFSNFLRSLLNYAEKNFIPLDEEIRILTMYIELESLRFDKSFHYEISVDENLSNDVVFVPSLMIQPFAENAIWHGLLHKEGDKKINIRFAADGGEVLHCIIEDNGIGREKAAAIKNNNISAKVHESKGVEIIRQRLHLLQQKTGKPASVNFEDIEPSGTRVTINIPYYNPEEI